MPAYKVDIQTVRAPHWTPCRPKFGSHREAYQYGCWLTRRNPDRILATRAIRHGGAEPDAVFNRELLWY